MQLSSSGGGLGICAEFCASMEKKFAGVKKRISPTEKSSGLASGLKSGCAARSGADGISHFGCAAMLQQDFSAGAQHSQSDFSVLTGLQFADETEPARRLEINAKTMSRRAVMLRGA
jgi:hypothetical protein